MEGLSYAQEVGSSSTQVLRMEPGTYRSVSPISNFSFEDLEPILVPNISIIYPPFSTEMDQTRRAVEDLTPADLDEEIEVSAEEYACRMPA